MLWDRRFLKKLNTLRIHVHLYKCYVDDIIDLLDPIRSGWDYDEKSNNMKYTTPTSVSTNVGVENRTFDILSIKYNIQFTTDIPSNHEDGKMPVLDIKVWVEVMDGQPKLLHTFYKKTVASAYTILEKSAMGKGTKISTLFQEPLRRLRNISPSLPFSDSIPNMNQWPKI